MSTEHSHHIQALSGTNYSTWAEEMKALLRSKGLWMLADGRETTSSAAGEEQTKWDLKEHQDDPAATWTALKALYVQQKPGTCFVAYDEFFSIRKRQEESLSAVTARVEQSMSRIQELHPSTFTLKDVNNELFYMAMIHSLGKDYYHFTSSLSLLSTLDKSTVKAAFQAEDINCQPCPDGAEPVSGDYVLAAAAGTCGCSPNVPCNFCEKPGHCNHKCYARQCAKEAHKASKHSGKGKRANQAQGSANSTSGTSASTTTSTHASAFANSATITSRNPQDVVEHAGNASFRSSDPSDPLSPLQLNADADWNADSGATSHMTPHCHWLQSLESAPITLDGPGVLDQDPVPSLPQNMIPDVAAAPPGPAAVPLQSPIGIGARLPARRRSPSREWWRLSPAQLNDFIDNEEEDENADIAFSSTAVEPICRGNVSS
ncbi:hypothetical protein PAXINDRAFT_17563 [Paxillus involutus ATCC 200175]|uniref:DUF4219 domain-containing protein n=1 Tax=Paxillus involutus ATCC 200175 TaxID=664439 RepID=A0A0C9TEG2_PAXIN|nr:hypothetical protein PAXINDRAFT_17563 [Paxillus involutus ATCC 200175]